VNKLITKLQYLPLQTKSGNLTVRPVHILYNCNYYGIALHVPKLSFSKMVRLWSEGLKHVAIKIRITKHIVMFDGN